MDERQRESVGRPMKNLPGDGEKRNRTTLKHYRNGLLANRHGFNRAGYKLAGPA